MSEMETLTKLRAEWEASATTEERRTEIAGEVQTLAADKSRTCLHCKKEIVYLPHHTALIEGHVYSLDGYTEVSITGLCEFCFDRITAEPEEE